jgi:hypothetical protein
MITALSVIWEQASVLRPTDRYISKGKNPATDSTDESMGGSASRCTRDGCKPAHAFIEWFVKWDRIFLHTVCKCSEIGSAHCPAMPDKDAVAL